VADALVAGPFDAVGVVAGSFDDARVGPVAAFGVEVALAGDVGPESSEDMFVLVRGESPRGRWPGGRCGRCV
jgi:hypothetical protein